MESKNTTISFELPSELLGIIDSILIERDCYLNKSGLISLLICHGLKAMISNPNDILLRSEQEDLQRIK